MLTSLAKLHSNDQSTFASNFLENAVRLTKYFNNQIKLRQDVGESRRVIRVLCEYISTQCSRPPPAHSKDLHSTIVAAFSCCASWLFAHPDLGSDNECLHLILQVIELGISGAKSQVIILHHSFLPFVQKIFSLFRLSDRENRGIVSSET